ncbi:putative cytochrome P450 [Stachybotrys elegans]|uniref:Cytochrome P450 n=1 Tax=Stachybotrys elegans TaxID=80388 RepID=A0A8K0WNE8_9HYPO|nr:putative cytochrome P450 [Stachybotrys elegans]
MAYPSLQIVTAGLVLLSGFCIHKILQIGRRPDDLPPGPPTIPILGNLHLIPERDAHLQFQKWAQEYGPVYSLMLGTKTMIVLSSDKAIKDVMDKKSAITSDRVDMYIGQTIASGGLRILMMKYGQTWRMVRRIMHELLNVKAAQAFEPYQILENQQMMYEILTDPDNFVQHVRRYSNSLMTTTTFGYRVPNGQDPHFKELFETLEQFLVLAGTGLAALLDYLPILQWLPTWMLSIKRRAQENHRKEKVLYRYHWDKAKAGVLSSENSILSFSVGLVREQKKHGFNDDFAAYITGTLLEAGTDTTANTLIWFLCAMLLFPKVQERAKSELDRVVGTERMPLPEDEPNLHYIRGCVKESLRWMSTTVTGAMPHALLQEDYYMGFRLPKGAALMNNVYTIHRDPDRYPRPHEFDPDRFKDDRQSSYDAAVNSDVSQRDHFSFGAGRRICPGMHVADRNLFLGISRLLWAFEFKRPLDDKGEEIVPDPSKASQGFLIHPLPFEAVIVPRDSKRAGIIRYDWENAKMNKLDLETLQWKHSPGDT